MAFEWLKKKKKKKAPSTRKRVKHFVKIGKSMRPVARRLLVADLMSRKIVSVNPFATLDKAVETFLLNNITGAPVLHKEFFIGEISKTDILNMIQKDSLENLTDEDKKVLSRISVADVMKKPICIEYDAPVEEAENMMAKYKISRLLVLDKKKNLIGIITKTDLAKGRSKEEIKKIVSTKVDDMLTILEKKGHDTFKSLSTQLGVPESVIENWCKILEEHGLVEIDYPAIGNPSVKLKYKEL